MTKKLMALLLAVLMAVSLLPMPAMADDAQVITDLSGISAGGSYVVDKSVKDIVLSAPLTLNKDVTLELTGQTVTLKLADGESYADASVFHVESGSLTLKGSGTVKVPDSASGVVVAKDAAVTISGEVGISGGANGVKATSGESRVKISVNTLGTIESDVGINLSGASGEIKIASGTVKGSVCAIAPDKDNALTLGKMLDGSTLYIGGTAATEAQLAAAPTAEMKELVFDDGKAPVLTISSAVRTSETEGSVTFTASKAGTYYYQLDGEPASAADIMKDEAKAELVRGANTISLKDLDANTHTVYIAAKDAFGHTTELLTAAIPAVLAAPTAPVWDGKKAAWTGVEGVNDYTVQLYLGSDAYGDPIPVNGASATDDLSDVMKDDGVYTFAVRSVGANTVGAWSERSAETVRDTAAPILTVPADGGHRHRRLRLQRGRQALLCSQRRCRRCIHLRQHHGAHEGRGQHAHAHRPCRQCRRRRPLRRRGQSRKPRRSADRDRAALSRGPRHAHLGERHHLHRDVVGSPRRCVLLRAAL